jgi:hypothetical protein
MTAVTPRAVESRNAMGASVASPRVARQDSQVQTRQVGKRAGTHRQDRKSWIHFESDSLEAAILLGRIKTGCFA